MQVALCDRGGACQTEGWEDEKSGCAVERPSPGWGFHEKARRRKGRRRMRNGTRKERPARANSLIVAVLYPPISLRLVPCVKPRNPARSKEREAVSIGRVYCIHLPRHGVQSANCTR